SSRRYPMPTPRIGNDFFIVRKSWDIVTPRSSLYKNGWSEIGQQFNRLFCFGFAGAFLAFSGAFFALTGALFALAGAFFALSGAFFALAGFFFALAGFFFTLAGFFFTLAGAFFALLTLRTLLALFALTGAFRALLGRSFLFLFVGC